MLWQAKKQLNDTYTDMKTPSKYSIQWEDLDNDSYRSVTTGNLIRNPVSKKWYSGSFEFNYLTSSEAESILDMINVYPLYIRAKSPLFGTNGFVELKAYVSKASIEMLQNTDSPTYKTLKFNIIQSEIIGGQ